MPARRGVLEPSRLLFLSPRTTDVAGTPTITLPVGAGATPAAPAPLQPITASPSAPKRVLASQCTLSSLARLCIAWQNPTWPCTQQPPPSRIHSLIHSACCLCTPGTHGAKVEVGEINKKPASTVTTTNRAHHVPVSALCPVSSPSPRTFKPNLNLFVYPNFVGHHYSWHGVSWPGRAWLGRVLLAEGHWWGRGWHSPRAWGRSSCRRARLSKESLEHRPIPLSLCPVSVVP